MIKFDGSRSDEKSKLVLPDETAPDKGSWLEYVHWSFEINVSDPIGCISN